MLALLAAWSAPVAGQAGSDVSLGTLLRGGARASADPELEDLQALLAELRTRPVADAAGNKSIAAAAQAIEQLRGLLARQVAGEQLVRAKQVAWAALSVADRVFARADAEAMLRAAHAHAQHAHASVPPTAASTRGTELSSARIAALAPDFQARVKRAQADADAAKATDARDDLQARAQLLAAAARAEAERVELMRQAAAIESAAQRADQAAVSAQLATQARAQELRDAEAATLARAQAASAFAEATAVGPMSVERREIRARAAAFFVQRARLTLAAATAMHADAPAISAARREIEAAAAIGTARDAALPAALRALSAALRALGDARAHGHLEQPDPAVAADLLARVAELGFPVERQARGVVITLHAAFLGSGAQLSPVTRARLTLLRASLAAFPHGDIGIEPAASSTASRQRVAAQRARAVRSLLDPARARVLPVLASVAPAATDSDDLALILPAYAMLAPQ